MRTRAQRLLAAGLALGLSAAVAQAQAPAIPPKYKASAIEVAQLPRYCYAQYVDGAFGNNPAYSIPHELCGYGMNHFCPALVYMIQASDFKRPRNERRGLAGSALHEINYTIQNMKPGCHITADVYKAKERAQALVNMLKY